MSQDNSFISMMEKSAILYKNSVEILTKINDAITTTNSTVTINSENTDGTISNYTVPSFSNLNNSINLANTNIQKLSGLQADNSVIITDTNSTRKIISVDVSREPKPIESINTVTTFKQSNNWFFDSLINPLLSVQLDLNGKVNDNINKILSRRYIVKFEKNVDGTLTTNGQASLDDFKVKFLNKNNFTINEFINWKTNTTNTGTLNSKEPDFYMDEQFFDLNYKEVLYKGYYSVMKIETDNINKRVWYHLNTINYFGKDGSTGTLSIGDYLMLNKSGTFSKYRITEINTSNSLFRIGLEITEGYDPVPVGTNVLEYYSDMKSQKTVNISIGFDEYNVIFIKPINTQNYVMGSSWSKGVAYYSNDLVLDTDSKVNMDNFYITKVMDYGSVLDDLVKKKIPSTAASVPNIPTLKAENFKVVQINKHLTDTKDADTLKKLHSQKNTSKSKLSQLDEAIMQKNKEINTKIYKSSSDKDKAQIELEKLIKNKDSETKQYTSLVQQISNTKSDGGISAKFRVRGFWDFPAPIIKTGYKSQEVIGFEIQYRYSSKYGTQNKTEGFTNTTNSNKKETAYFSEWNPLKTDIRKRSYNETTSEWYWEIEDVSDADTPNVNQLDIAIQPDERVEIRIRSISEVGYPDSIIMSEYSEIMSIDFPTELKDVSGENEFILAEASKESVSVDFENKLSSMGIVDHISSSYFNNDSYVAHNGNEIISSLKDSNGKTLSMNDAFVMLLNKINALEESIKRTKGELRVTLFKGVDETVLENGSKTNINVYCDDYSVLTSESNSAITYQNNIYMIQDYFLVFENISTDNPLGILTSKNDFGFTNPNNIPTVVDEVGIITALNTQQKHFIKVLDKSAEGAGLYDGKNTSYASISESNNIAGVVLVTDNKNLGGNITGNISSPDIWYVNTDTSTGAILPDGMGTLLDNSKLGATVFPMTELQNITSTEAVKSINPTNTLRIPINIYFKLDITKTSDTEVTIEKKDTPIKRQKKIRLQLDMENKSTPFVLQLNFTLIRNRVFTQQNQQTSSI